MPRCHSDALFALHFVPAADCLLDLLAIGGRLVHTVHRDAFATLAVVVDELLKASTKKIISEIMIFEVDFALFAFRIVDFQLPRRLTLLISCRPSSAP